MGTGVHAPLLGSLSSYMFWFVGERTQKNQAGATCRAGVGGGLGDSLGVGSEWTVALVTRRASLKFE